MTGFVTYISLLICLSAIVSSSIIPTNQLLSFPFGSNQNVKRYFHEDNKIRGTNLGGWLLLEPYITPSLFENFLTDSECGTEIPVDEYHFCKVLGTKEASRRLQQHWSTFYTEEDFRNIASSGLNLVRIPIGYWAFATLPDDPYITEEQEVYLDRAIQWARNNGLKVWIDLHGAAGSQNGFDNSGLRDHYAFLEPSNLEITMKALKYILQKYSQDAYLDTVVGIELLNEPLGPVFDLDRLKKDFLLPAYDYLKDILPNKQTIIIHDAFQPYQYWDNFLPDTNYIIIDHHHYQVFSSLDLVTDIEEKIKLACSWGSTGLLERHPSVGGEFSAALTDCARWLNGVGRGARYDGTFATSPYLGSCDFYNDISRWTPERLQHTRMLIEAQLDAFEMKHGWIFWCYKTEDAIEWDLSKLIKYGLFPQPLTDRKHGDQCHIK